MNQSNSVRPLRLALPPGRLPLYQIVLALVLAICGSLVLLQPTVWAADADPESSPMGPPPSIAEGRERTIAPYQMYIPSLTAAEANAAADMTGAPSSRVAGVCGPYQLFDVNGPGGDNLFDRFEVNLAGKTHSLVAGVSTIESPTKTFLLVYCVNADIVTSDGAQYCSSTSPFVGTTNEWKVAWLMDKYAPVVNNLADFPLTAGCGTNGVLCDARVQQAARQAAVWKLTNGHDINRSDPIKITDPGVLALTSPPQTEAELEAAVLTVYDALLAAIPAQSPAEYLVGPLDLKIKPMSATNTLPAEADHPFTVQLTKGGQPLAGYTVNVSSNFGVLNQSSAQTDSNGVASFVLTSNAPGTANIEATATVTLPDRTLFTNTEEKQPLGRMDRATQTITAQATKTWIQPLYTLGDRVWYDQNQNGIQDPTEPSYPDGVTVELYDNATCAGTAVMNTTSGGNGLYGFSNLLPGTYSVKFSGIPAGWSISPADQGSDGSLDSDANNSGCIENINLTADDPTQDIGISVPGTLGDNVLCVSTGQGLANIGVTLFKDFNADGVADGAAIATTSTDSTGFYEFTGLEVALAGDPNNTTKYIVVVDVNDPDLGSCNVSIPPTQYNPPLDSDHPNDPNNDFKFEEQPLVCSLAIDKTCQVIAQPPTDLFCTAKIAATTLRYTGPSRSNVTVEFISKDKNAGSVTYPNVNLVSGVTILASQNGFTIDARPNDLGAKMTIRVNGVEEVIHTSCSAPYLAGQPAPLDSPKGAPSPNWLVVNFVDKDSDNVVAVPAPSSTSQDSCTVTNVSLPSCQVLKDNGQKLTSVTFKYTGGGCSASSNTQDSGKATCTGNVNTAQPVTVNSSNGYAVAPQTVNLNGEFTVSASSFSSNSIFTLANGGGTETDQIHTSCSQPLAVGDVFGSLTVAAINGSTGGAEVTYSYKVTNWGNSLTEIKVTDDLLGAIAGPFSLGAGESKTVSKTTNIFATTTNTGFASGTLANGAVCEAPADSVTVTVEEPCDVCKGGTTELTFEYRGVDPANVAVYDKSDSSDASKILFQGTVQPGDKITIKPRAGQSKLNNDISLYVNGQFNTKLHTSCSQPIGPGLVSGDFEIVKARSKDNGRICPLNACAPQAANSLVLDKEKLKWTVTNSGDLGLEIKQVTISWPAAFGNLVEMKADGTFFKGSLSTSGAVDNTTPGWTGNVDDRTLKPGDTKNFEFKFSNNVSLGGDVQITIDFTSGCSITVKRSGGGTPPTGTQACTSKISATTLKYIGPSLSGMVDVSFQGKNKKAEAPANYSFSSGLPTGTVLKNSAQNDFTIDARPEDLGSKLTITINGVAEVIHTSCSVPYVAGQPAPLDNPKGNPSPNWLVVNFEQK